MSAIELMDPKMDAGMVHRSSQSKPISFDNAVAVSLSVLSISIEDYRFCLFQSGKLKLTNIPQVELISIMDTTMASFVSALLTSQSGSFCVSYFFSIQITWLEGHSLAQTVFTNLYTHKPFEIGDRVLKAYIIGVLKLISVCTDVIRRAYVCEEVCMGRFLVWGMGCSGFFGRDPMGPASVYYNTVPFSGRLPTNVLRLSPLYGLERFESYRNVERS